MTQAVGAANSSRAWVGVVAQRVIEFGWLLFASWLAELTLSELILLRKLEISANKQERIFWKIPGNLVENSGESLMLLS
jgi:hypothetical protein